MNVKEKTNKELFTQLTESYADLTGTNPMQAKLYKKGEHIFREGQIPRGVYYIKSGWVKIYRNDSEANERVLRLVGKNEFIGYLSLLKRWDFRSSAVAIVDTEVYFITKQIFLDLLSGDNHFARLVIQMLCNELAYNENHITDLLTKSVRQRLATILLGLEQAADHDPKLNGNRIGMSKKDIASVVNITPETLSRQLSAFANEGLIALENNHIDLKNREGLLNISNIED